MRKSIIALLTLLYISSACSAQGTLKDALAKHDILFGAALNVDEIFGRTPGAQEAIVANFNAAVAEDCMKAENLRPRVDEFYWEEGDKFVEFCEKNNLAATGHCLVWHSQPAVWMFTDSLGQPANRPLLIKRMREHILTIVGRYKGRIKGWDVVNEMIEDNGEFRKTPFYELIGPDYIELALKFAHEADPDAELYLNDYSMAKPAKREAYIKLIKDLRAKGCRIDAIGMQSHNGIDYPELDEYEKSIEEFGKNGLKVMFTELDLNILPSPEKFLAGGAEISDNFEYDVRLNPYTKGLTKEAQKCFDDRYKAFFEIYSRHADVISRITLWGVSDKNSWLNNWPVKGRTSYPLLLDRKYKVKPVVKELTKMFE